MAQEVSVSSAFSVVKKNPTQTSGACKSWCARHEDPWIQKCWWPENTCNLCSECEGIGPNPNPPSPLPTSPPPSCPTVQQPCVDARGHDCGPSCLDVWGACCMP